MSFRYDCLNLEAIASLPLKCTCEDKERSQAMKNHFLSMISDGKIKYIQIKGREWEIKPTIVMKDKIYEAPDDCF